MRNDQKTALNRFIKRRNVKSYQDLVIQRHKCMERMLLAMADYLIPEKVSPHEWKPMSIPCHIAATHDVPVKPQAFTVTINPQRRSGKV
jgi:hypothetical protein